MHFAASSRLARTLLAAGLVLLGCLPAAVAQPTDPYAAVRPQFVQAYAAASMSAGSLVETDSEALRTYPLYPYLQAARLQRQLDQQTATRTANANAGPSLPVDTGIAAFLDAQGDLPATRALRNRWLASLAARQDWATYAAQFRADRDTSPALRCHGLSARIALGRTAGITDDLTALWLTPRSLPDACDPPFAWWAARGGPGEALTLRRARLALAEGEAGLARHLARSLTPAAAAPVLQWAALIEQPVREITAAIAEPARPIEPQALQDGWRRYARADAQRAADTFPALVQARSLDPRSASPYALSVALALAWSRLPGALDFFALVHADDFDESAYEWHARAALWAGDWKRAAGVIAAMPESLRSQPRWQYWAARASERLGDFARARAGYAAVIPTDNWYAVHAAARLDRKFVPTLQPLPLDDRTIDQLAAEPGFVRARELLLCGMESEASGEWRASYDALTPGRQQQAVGLASRWGWHIQAISSAAKLKIFNDYDLLYPRPFDPEVHAASRTTRLPDSLIYAIIRQESLYRADAASAAGAVGLMQLLPSTARLTAQRMGVPPPMRAQLLLPRVNIPLGSAFLAGLVDRFDGETALATAAYNAGPNAARRWLPAMPLDLDVWAENIPFNETRAYVQRVAWHQLVFAWLDKREPQDVKSWLRSVVPLDTPMDAAAAPR
jgi:soluble lytic murein transglycosylase